MPIEQRIVSSKTKELPDGSNGAGPDTEDAPAGKSKKKLVIVLAIVVALVVNAAAIWFFAIKPSGESADSHAQETPHVEETHEPGAIGTAEPMSINLANGRFLRLGFAVQFALDDAGGHGAEAPDMSSARDVAIALYSGQDMATVNDAAGRDHLKSEFIRLLNETYGEGHVLDVYLTDYVTQ